MGEVGEKKKGRFHGDDEMKFAPKALVLKIRLRRTEKVIVASGKICKRKGSSRENSSQDPDL